MPAPEENLAKPVRPTHQQHRERVAMCRKLLGRCLHDGEIKSLLSARYGISRRTVERYLRRAREQMTAETGQPRAVLQAESVEFYRHFASNKKEKTRDRLLARERIDKVLGLEAPTKIAGHDGGPLSFAAILAAATSSEPPGDEHTSNVVDVEAEVARITAEHRAGRASEQGG